MPARRMRKKRGGGIMSKLKNAASSANKFLKDTKAISTVANLAAASGYAPQAAMAGKVAGQLGYGRRPKRVAHSRLRPVF